MRYLVTHDGSVVTDVEAPNPEEAAIRAAGKQQYPVGDDSVKVYPIHSDPEGGPQVYTGKDLAL